MEGIRHSTDSDTDDKYEEEYEYEPGELEVPFKSKLKPHSEIIEILQQNKIENASSSTPNLACDPETLIDNQPVNVVAMARIECLIDALSSEDESILVPIPYPSSLQNRYLYVNSVTFPFDKRKETISILNKMHDLCKNDFHATKRELFYATQLVGFIEYQFEFDMIIDNCVRTLGIPEWNLNIVEANKMGVVIGKLVFYENGHLIDCARMGSGGKVIPPFIDRVYGMTSDALYILLVDKDSTYVRLMEDMFYNTHRCIILMANGHDFATKLFLRKMKLELGLPVLALVDCSPNGLNILSVYGSGPKNMICPDIMWVGLKPSDLDTYNIFDCYKLPMTEEDIELGNNLLENKVVMTNELRKKELKTMLDCGYKADIEILSSIDFKYLAEVYLPKKLQEKDWI